jgi:ferrous iron transport protein B
MKLTIALAGNPNSGKTTLFNALTGSNQFVGNWPGVTVEKKEGKLKFDKEVTITDLPGIYSLSPYTLEEVVSRNYLLNEKPDAILNIVDGTNLERNLYLTTQLLEIGIPTVIAVNMADIIEKTGQKINLNNLSKSLGVPVLEISALKGIKIKEAAEKAVAAAKSGKHSVTHSFSKKAEAYIDRVEQVIGNDVDESQRRFFAIKLIERDEKIISSMSKKYDVSDIVSELEDAFDDDSESIITNERYEYISSIIGSCLTKKSGEKLSTSDKIDRIVTNRILALPIFAVVMFIVYYISVTTVGTYATDWANDGVFGDGWHLFGIGSSAYNEVADEFGEAAQVVNGFVEYAGANGMDTEEVEAALDTESEDFDAETAKTALDAFAAQFTAEDVAEYVVIDDETMADETVEANGEELAEAVEVYESYDCTEPDPADYGVWIPGVPVFVESFLTSINCADWLSGLILDGIVAGVGAVLGFVPQMLVLFIFLAFLEACGYMARIAFVLDRIFRRFGLSGKGFIPILIGTGCGVPGVMASRTIENERDRRMTIMTTTFIPCGAKLPFIAMIAGAIFGGAAWVAPSAYFLGMAAIIISGIMLKKTQMFAGEPAPFVMELPAYHMPTVGNVLRSMWERGWSFIKKAGTIILVSTILVWATTYFGFVDGTFRMLTEDEIDCSILAVIGNAIHWIFTPLGWGNWQATVASITGLVAKENIVGTMGILYGGGDGTVYQNLGAAFTSIAGYSFLTFNLLCAPCFAAMGAIRREMNNGRWTAFAITYQCVFAYCIALIVYRIGGLIIGAVPFGVGTIAAIVVAVAIIYLLVRPYRAAAAVKTRLSVES